MNQEQTTPTQQESSKLLETARDIWKQRMIQTDWVSIAESVGLEPKECRRLFRLHQDRLIDQSETLEEKTATAVMEYQRLSNALWIQADATDDPSKKAKILKMIETILVQTNRLQGLETETTAKPPETIITLVMPNQENK